MLAEPPRHPVRFVVHSSAGGSLGPAAIRRYLPLTLLWGVAWATLAFLVFGLAALTGALASRLPTGWTLLGATLGYGIMGGACGCIFAGYLQEFPVRRDGSSLPGRRGTVILSMAATLAFTFAGARLSVGLLGFRPHGIPVLLVAGFGHMALGALSGTATMAIARRGAGVLRPLNPSNRSVSGARAMARRAGDRHVSN